MHIAFDNIIFSLQNSGGISNYWHELTKRFLEQCRSIRIIERQGDQNIHGSRKVNHKCRLELPLQFYRYSPSITVLEPNTIFHSSYYRFSIHPNAVNISTVHDFIYEKFMSGLPRVVHSLQKRLAIKHSKGIICVSNSTKRDLLQQIPSAKHIPIAVIHNGVNRCFKTLNHKTDKANILYIGSRASYKNFKQAALTVSLLSKKYHFHIIGGGPLTKTEVDFLSDLIPNQYTHLGSLTNEEINSELNKAHCLLYPSSYEGFGIPVVEALNAGCPVVACDIPAIREITCGRYPLSRTSDPSELALLVRSFENDVFRSRSLKIGYEIGEIYSWDRCFNETRAFYKEIVANLRK